MTDDRDIPGFAEIDDADLIADVTGTLDARSSEHLAARLRDDPSLRARRERIAELVADVARPVDEVPPFAALRGPWTSTPQSAPAWAPPVPAAPPPVESSPVVAMPAVASGRRRRSVAVLAAAASLVVIVGSVVAVRSLRFSDDVAPMTASVLAGAPREVLALASDATVEASTARIAVSGDGLMEFDGDVLGRPGERVEVGVRLTGDGEVRFTGETGGPPADYRLRTSFVGVSGPTVAQPELTVSEVVRVDGRTYRSDDGVVFEEDSVDAAGDTNGDAGGTGAFGLLVLQPDVLGRLDELVRGEVRDLGVDTIDGVEHRHLAFTASPQLFADDITDPAEIEVWVSADDGTVSRYTVSVDGPLVDDVIPNATVQFEVVVDVADLGVDLAISVPG